VAFSGELRGGFQPEEGTNMTEEIIIEVSILERILNEMRTEGLRVTTTINILRKYQGGYLKNSGISASQSFNAKFGKALKRQEVRLGIREVEQNLAVVDDFNGRTTCSAWAI
jgi:hypothetical protein